MPINDHDIASRSANRAKRRKTNIILNTLISIVIILIIIVGSKIFLSDTKTEQVEKKIEQQKSEKEQNKDNQQNVTESMKLEDGKVDTTDNSLDTEDVEDTEKIETESNEENVEKVITNPAWKPIGTEQTAGHQSSYSRDSIDWNEKLKAAAYAIDTTTDQMTTWWLEGGDNPEIQSILTVSAKGNDDVYRVYIEWIDGEGWKPTEIKKLIKNDRK